MTACNSINSLKDLRILIVDNEKAIAIILEKLLTSRGSYVKTVFSAKEGLVILKEDKIDVAFIDINLGENSISGFDLIREFKTQTPENCIKSIAISGYHFDDIEDQFTDAGFDDYLAKPFKLADVLKKLGKLIK